MSHLELNSIRLGSTWLGILSPVSDHNDDHCKRLVPLVIIGIGSRISVLIDPPQSCCISDGDTTPFLFSRLGPSGSNWVVYFECVCSGSVWAGLVCYNVIWGNRLHVTLKLDLILEGSFRSGTCMLSFNSNRSLKSSSDVSWQRAWSIHLTCLSDVSWQRAWSFLVPDPVGSGWLGVLICCRLTESVKYWFEVLVFMWHWSPSQFWLGPSGSNWVISLLSIYSSDLWNVHSSDLLSIYSSDLWNVHSSDLLSIYSSVSFNSECWVFLFSWSIVLVLFKQCSNYRW